MRPRIPARTDPREQHVRRGVRRLAPRRRAVDAEPRARAARAHVAVAAEGDGGDRGRAVLDARRRARPAGDHARGGRRRPGREGRRGRLDDPPAAGARQVPARPGADAVAQAPGGVPGDAARAAPLPARDPAGLPRRRLLRSPRLRGAGRGRDVLLAAGRPPDDGAGGAARRAPAGTHRVRPARASRRGAPAPARGARRAARLGGDLGAARSGRPTAARCICGPACATPPLGRSRSSSTPGAS